MSRARSFHHLSVRGHARSLRPLAEAALRSYDIDVLGLRLVGNDWNGVFRIETPTRPRVIGVTRPVPGALPRPVPSEVAFMTATAAETGIAVPPVFPDRDGELSCSRRPPASRRRASASSSAGSVEPTCHLA